MNRRARKRDDRYRDMLGLLSSFANLLLILAAETFFFHQNADGALRRDDFPPGFVFGAGSSAYQVEGAVAEDGRSASIWDTFTHAGKMADKSTADVTSDQYHHYKEDVKLMRDVGLDAYRFSISWSRLIPGSCNVDGRGAVNPKGVSYYNSLINELISHGIQPHATIYHLDLPQILEDEYGGWLSPRIVEDFTAYADACFREFGDRVAHWTTINQPNILGTACYDIGIWPPGRCSSVSGYTCPSGNSSVEPYIATHHALLAHASAAMLYRKNYQAKRKGFIGLNLYGTWLIPYTNSTADIQATKRSLEFSNGWILGPLVYGDYPQVMKENVGERLPSFTTAESERIKGSFDFVGVNHYATVYVEDDPQAANLTEREYYSDMFAKFRYSKDGVPSSQFLPFNLSFLPFGLQEMLEYYKTDYGNPPVYVQENGLGLPSNESLHDITRIKYIDGFLNATLGAVRNGANTKGYFVWSFLDCFELLGGYTRRCGLYHVDFENDARPRQAKRSAHWFAASFKKNVQPKMDLSSIHQNAAHASY